MATCRCVRVETYLALREVREDAAAVLLTAFPDDPTGLGRILRDDEGELVGIREERDCDPIEQEIDEINVGIYCYDAAALRPALERLDDQNAQGELYLTDTVEHLLDQGRRVESVVVLDSDEALGVNSLVQLALARSVMQAQINEAHMLAGVLIEDPATTYIDWGVTIGKDTHVLPCTVIRRGVAIGEGCEVGPFAHLRVGATLEDGAEVGNFVEVKKSRDRRAARRPSTSPTSATPRSARGANIGCGTITANYDGKREAPDRRSGTGRSRRQRHGLRGAASTIGDGRDDRRRRDRHGRTRRRRRRDLVGVPAHRAPDRSATEVNDLEAAAFRRLRVISRAGRIPQLARDIARTWACRSARSTSRRFPDGEIDVKVDERRARRTTCSSCSRPAGR